ncbi:MAG: two-component system response regulator [Spirochaetae bacterium HGW-Spirochaetae-1]|jgi:CheY-like chemotaxis protein|nr:MAG: two-component system response regulator [Spirochaetae bacterium HGW-Spirochaetae-1]
MENRPFSILLIDDNDDHAELVIRSLTKHPMASTIYHVTDGNMALEHLSIKNGNSAEELKERPDLILLDLRLPKIDGLEVLRKIKSTPETQAIPTVVLTTSQAPQDIMRAYQLHANGYMVKPLEYSLFSELMIKMADYWMKCNVGIPR